MINAITVKKSIAATAFVFLASYDVQALAATTTLTAGIWTISGFDVAGHNWAGSTLTFESETPVGNDYALSGYFYWTGDAGQYYGRENFTGTLFANNSLSLHGVGLVAPTKGIITGVAYAAEVLSDGHHIVNGDWSGAGGIPSHAWTAVQAVPLSGAYGMFLAGLGFLGYGAKKKKNIGESSIVS